MGQGLPGSIRAGAIGYIHKKRYENLAAGSAGNRVGELQTCANAAQVICKGRGNFASLAPARGPYAVGPGVQSGDEWPGETCRKIVGVRGVGGTRLAVAEIIDNGDVLFVVSSKSNA